MIHFERFELKNGLKVLVHQDKTTPIVAVNLLYDVGARDENPERTGFAHLFEHLMFGGSKNIPSYDEPLQRVGGENNAFTSNDLTNYYVTLPKVNMETAFWLESDRMNELAFTPKSLDVQRNVVIEEFRQRYLNQPYGDVWLHLRPLAYKVHPYKWPTIGKDISHIEQARMEDVKQFFYSYYRPNNAILSVAGDVTVKEIEKLSSHWFGDIPPAEIPLRKLTAEPEQQEKRTLTLKRDVPLDAIYMTFHSCSRNDPDYYTLDLLSDILSRGKSARLYQKLVKEKRLFSDINAYISGDLDKGLFIISGKLMKGIPMQDAENAIFEELERLKGDLVAERELEKVVNKVESIHLFEELSVLNKAMNLAIAELISGAELVNQELAAYQRVSLEDLRIAAKTYLKEDNCSILYYMSKQN